MATRTALITGVLGQDGSLLAELLLSRGYRVVGVTRSGSEVPVAGPLREVIFVTCDLAESSAVRLLIESWQPDELYHLAAFHHSSQDRSINSVLASKQAMLAVNFLSTKTLAFTLAELGSPCHLIYAASSQMYTARGMADEIDESSAWQPSTFYGHTKAWSMALLNTLRNDSALRASGAILFNHESPRRGARFVSRKITIAAAQAAAGGRPTLELQNIGTRVDWSSASDVVEALSLMAKSDAPRDYVVASGILHSVRDLLDIAFGHVNVDWRSYTVIKDDSASPAILGRAYALEHSLGWRRHSQFECMVCDMVDCDRQALEYPRK